MVYIMAIPDSVNFNRWSLVGGGYVTSGILLNINPYFFSFSSFSGQLIEADVLSGGNLLLFFLI